MKPLPYSFLFLFSLLFFVTAISQPKKPLTGRAPLWTAANNYNYNDNRLDHEAEDGYFDVYYEKQVSLGEQSVFIKRAMKIITEAGIQNNSEISVSFEPSYEQLIFHSIRIIRGNEIINHLNLSKIKTIQQEKELNRHLYDGSLSAVLFLEDVRKGDIIEYSYTLKGFNPIFKNKYADTYDADFRVPVGSLFYRLVVPKGRQVIIKNNNTGVKPAIQSGINETVYEWRLNQIKPVRLQDNIPSWYDPYSIIMVSEFKSWKEVNSWAMELFPPINDISPALQKKIADIKKEHTAPEDRVLAALRFVQDDVRYMGIEMGENSHKPHHPDKIFLQRFGDCKDKSYLLCTILHKLGMQAYPVLINTTYKKTIMERLPSPFGFDHTTVLLKLNNKEYWFDPTISFQRGAIDLISYPDYQCGLVVDSTTDGLATIKNKEPGKVEIKEMFDIPDLSGKAGLTVTTQYSGSFADDMRSSFSNNSKYEMQKTFRDFYTDFYEQITADSIEVTDNETAGFFLTKEYYTINNLWKTEGDIKKAHFDPYVIDGVIKKPKEINRTMPFELMWPVKYKENIEINLPEPWSAKQSSDKIENPYFLMTANFSFDGDRKINLEYSYEGKKDHVMPDEMDNYLDGLNKRDNDFSYILSYSPDDKPVNPLPEEKEKANNFILYIGFIAVLIIGGIIWEKRRG
jgi:Domain of Unknown Function with PDB structure (DUF3857)